MTSRPVADRLLDGATEDIFGCVLWGKSTNNQGYGVIGVDGSTRLAHRVSYETFVGPIGDGLVLDHTCQTPRCINPAHLDEVTQRENVQRAWGRNGKKTHCRRGHELSGHNLYVPPSGNRYCRECGNARGRAYRASKRKEGTNDE